MHSEPSLTPADIIERSQWDFFWIPADASLIDRPELLLVRCPRDVAMLNSVTRTRPVAGSFDALVEEVGQAHQGVTSRWLVRDLPSHRALSPALDRAGYVPIHDHGAYWLGLPHAGVSIPTPAVRAERVRDMAGLCDWYSVADAVFGAQRPPAQDLQRFLEACTRQAARVHRFVAYRGKRAVSCGALTSFPSLRFAYLWGGGTLSSDRGCGAYRAVLHARVDHATRLGLTGVGMYARDESSAPIVERVGFVRHGSMTYWDRLPGSTGCPK